ncbi:hypothetical protein [Rhodopseudomonas palustris]|uniref:hypothetical protein n=1 Tax=Rhodopseudomonas palustris TaxID=1076 RepID=UPI001AD7F3DD
MVTLHDARAFLIRLPTDECNTPRWQAALAAVLMVGSDGGPTDFARIGMMHALRSHGKFLNETSRRKRGAARKPAFDE